MGQYRIKQGGNWVDTLELLVFTATSAGMVLTENRWGKLVAACVLVFCIWSLWHEWQSRVREIVVSDGISLISRKETKTLPLSDFCGIATFTDTGRGRIGNVFLTALVPAHALGKHLVLHQFEQSFARNPNLTPQEVDRVRQQVAAITGLQDFGDIGSIHVSELYLKCRLKI